VKKVQVDVYNQEILVFGSERDFRKWMKKNPIQDQEEMEERINTCSGLAGILCTEKDGVARWFIFLEESDLSTLSHEAVHVSYMMLELVGVEHDAQNHEALAYLQGYIFKEVAQVLKLPTLFD